MTEDVKAEDLKAVKSCGKPNSSAASQWHIPFLFSFLLTLRRTTVSVSQIFAFQMSSCVALFHCPYESLKKFQEEQVQRLICLPLRRIGAPCWIGQLVIHCIQADFAFYNSKNYFNMNQHTLFSVHSRSELCNSELNRT